MVVVKKKKLKGSVAIQFGPHETGANAAKVSHLLPKSDTLFLEMVPDFNNSGWKNRLAMKQAFFQLLANGNKKLYNAMQQSQKPRSFYSAPEDSTSIHPFRLTMAEILFQDAQRRKQEGSKLLKVILESPNGAKISIKKAKQKILGTIRTLNPNQIRRMIEDTFTPPASGIIDVASQEYGEAYKKGNLEEIISAGTKLVHLFSQEQIKREEGVNSQLTSSINKGKNVAVQFGAAHTSIYHRLKSKGQNVTSNDRLLFDMNLPPTDPKNAYISDPINALFRAEMLKQVGKLPPRFNIQKMRKEYIINDLIFRVAVEHGFSRYAALKFVNAPKALTGPTFLYKEMRDIAESGGNITEKLKQRMGDFMKSQGYPRGKA